MVCPSKYGVMPDTAAGPIVVLPVADWRRGRPLTVFYREDKHLPARSTGVLALPSRREASPALL